MKRICVVIVLALCASTAYGQSGPSAAADQPATIAEVKQLFQDMHFEKQVTAIQETMVQQTQAMFRQMVQGPEFKGLTPEKQEKVQEVMTNYMKDVLASYPASEMMDDFAPAYAKYLNHSDILVLRQFYASPTGQKFLDATPKIMGDAMQTLMPKMQSRVNTAMERLKQQIKEIMESGSGEQKPAPGAKP